MHYERDMVPSTQENAAQVMVGGVDANAAVTPEPHAGMCAGRGVTAPSTATMAQRHLR
jgi:hypothetical protein